MQKKRLHMVLKILKCKYHSSIKNKHTNPSLLEEYRQILKDISNQIR